MLENRRTDKRDERDLSDRETERPKRSLGQWVDSIFPLVPWSPWSHGPKKNYYITMTQYRYQLERYRGRSTRHVCPQCGRKNVFTRYVDTEHNNIYISDNVGKCNRLDKCGYHYTPHQYFTDTPWKRDTQPRVDGSRHCSPVLYHRVRERENREHPLTPPPEPKRVCAGLPHRVLMCSDEEALPRRWALRIASRGLWRAESAGQTLPTLLAMRIFLRPKGP